MLNQTNIPLQQWGGQAHLRSSALLGRKERKLHVCYHQGRLAILLHMDVFCGSCERSPCFLSLGTVPEVHKWLSPLLSFFLLSWEITELRVCLLVMRPEYVGIICGHQLINSRIKGRELDEGDACQILAEQRPLSVRGGSRGRWELGQERAARPCASCN